MCRLLLLLAVLTVAITLVEPLVSWSKNPLHWTKHESNDQNTVDGRGREDGRNNGDVNGGNNRRDRNGDRSENNRGRDVLSPSREENNKVTVPEDPEEAFIKLAKKTVADDKETLLYCNKHTHSGATEIFGSDSYKLIITGFDADNIEVKIRHRVILIKGEVPLIDARWSADNDGKWQDIRTLPHILDVKKATWVLKDGRLEITIPYKFPFNREVKKSCDVDHNVDDGEIIVPQGKDDKEDMIDPNVIDEIFGKTATNNIIGMRMSDIDDVTTIEPAPVPTEPPLTRIIYPDK